MLSEAKHLVWHDAAEIHRRAQDDARRPSMPYRRAFFATLLVLAALPGCARSTRPELGEVGGTITLDGRPLADAIVVFTPVEGGRQSMGVTDEDGRYTLRYLRDVPGAKIGPHNVAVTMSSEARFRGPLPPRYNGQTTLHANVRPGANTFDFPLSMK
ncbi:MAG: carboxypeptidase regulatory-like domain-containing protein [Pirellulales bacterium]|nr:carboxypeptidase regulatory-like domain-containing protein [Pirellulales bacterium]